MRHQLGAGWRAVLQGGTPMAPWESQRALPVSGHPEVQPKVRGYARLETRSGDWMGFDDMRCVPNAVLQIIVVTGPDGGHVSCVCRNVIQIIGVV